MGRIGTGHAADISSLCAQSRMDLAQAYGTIAMRCGSDAPADRRRCLEGMLQERRAEAMASDSCPVEEPQTPCVPDGSRCGLVEGVTTGWMQLCVEGFWADAVFCDDGCDRAAGVCKEGRDCCVPACKNLGKDEEGWYDPCRELLMMRDACDGCVAVCGRIGTPSEGWYGSCEGNLIRLEACGRCRD